MNNELERASQELRETIERLKEKLGADLDPVSFTQWAVGRIALDPKSFLIIPNPESWGEAN